MKIYYIANARIPTEKAHGLQIAKMCRSFADAGAKVELVIPRRFNGIKTDLFNYYGIKKNFQVVKLPCLDLFWLDKLLGNLALWLESVTFFAGVRLYFVGKKNDIIYSRDEFIVWFFGRSPSIILEIHNLPAKIKPFHLKIWRRAKKMVVITSKIKEELVGLGLAPEKILVASDAVDLEEFNIDISQEEARKKLSLSRDKKIVLYTGSFYYYNWKGVNVLLESLKFLPAGMLLALVGGQEEEINKIRNDFPADNLLLVLSRPHQEIPYYLKAADVLVLPNKSGNAASENYTSPLKLFEYMASRRPIIASDLPSLREVLNGNNSILVKPNDPEALAEGIKAALADDDLSQRIAEQAFSDVQNRTWNKRAAEIVKFINQ